MLWALYGILHSLLRAAFAETGRIYRIDGSRFAFGQALFGFILLLPFVPIMSWPADPHFYRTAVGAALIFSIGILIHLNLTAEKEGRVSGIYMPLEALASALIWIAVTPSLIDGYANNMLMTVSLLVAFVLSSVGLYKIRPHDLNWRTLMVMVPLALTYAVAGTVTKTVMPFFPVIPAALAYALIGFGVMTLVTGLAALSQKKLDREMVATRTVRASLLAGLVSACGYTAFVASVTLAPNPGYTSMLAMLLPVWLLIWHGLTRIEDKANALAALLIVIGSALLVVAAW